MALKLVVFSELFLQTKIRNCFVVAVDASYYCLEHFPIDLLLHLRNLCLAIQFHVDFLPLQRHFEIFALIGIDVVFHLVVFLLQFQFRQHMLALLFLVSMLVSETNKSTMLTFSHTSCYLFTFAFDFKTRRSSTNPQNDFANNFKSQFSIDVDSIGFGLLSLKIVVESKRILFFGAFEMN